MSFTFWDYASLGIKAGVTVLTFGATVLLPFLIVGAVRSLLGMDDGGDDA